MESFNWTDIERDYPRVNFMPSEDGLDECPECHGRGSIRRRNMQTLSPSDDYDATCEKCGGEGEVFIKDDRYGDTQ